MMLDFVFVCDWEQKWNDFAIVPGTQNKPQKSRKHPGTA